MSVYFCSDLHLSHRLAAYKRGFESIEAHNESIITTLQSQLTKRDLLYILGDVAMKEQSLALLHEVPCRKILVKGNHDKYRLKSYLRVFEDIHGIVKYKNMWLSHCPIHPQEMYRCVANVHGHIHKNTNSPQLDFPYINVNWDFLESAISLDEIRSLIDYAIREREDNAEFYK